MNTLDSWEQNFDKYRYSGGKELALSFVSQLFTPTPRGFTPTPQGGLYPAPALKINSLRQITNPN